MGSTMPTRARKPGDEGNGAYAFGLFGGGCSPHLQSALLAAIHALVHVEPVFPIVTMLGESCAGHKWLYAQLASAQVLPVHVSEVKEIPCGNRSKSSQGGRLVPTYTMGAIWNLTQYDVVLYLDSDLAVVRPLDHVIRALLREREANEYRTPVACRTAESTRSIGAPFNTGVWAVRPNATIYTNFVSWMRSNTDGRHFGCGAHTRAVARTQSYPACVSLTTCATSRHPPGIGFQDAATNYFSQPIGKRKSELRARSDTRSLHVGYNLKVDARPASCLRKQNVSTHEIYVVHWSGRRKPQRIRSNDLARTPGAVRVGLFTYLSQYCRILSLLRNSTSTNLTDACQRPRWLRFHEYRHQSSKEEGRNTTLAMWVRELGLSPRHPVRMCSTAASLGACLGVPSMLLL